MSTQNICNICGANYVYRNGRWACPACGAFKAEELSGEETTLLYNAAQKLRLADFAEAELAYTDIVEKYPENAEGYWGRLLSRYGIKYEEDFDGKRIPTCYATTIESVMSDRDYRRALELAEPDMQVYYARQANYIERVRKEWVEKASHEAPYDIFICYKDSDLANGIDRTQDSIAAQELYIHLVEQGYRVFFSRESLRDKVGEKYEPYIFNALSTAKVMLVYGTNPEYITSTWLKNEWTRYQKRMQAGEKKEGSLVTVCDGFSPNELPRTLAANQCFDATKRSFYSDLDKKIRELIQKTNTQSEKKIDFSSDIKSHQNNSEFHAVVCPACGGNFAASDLLDGDDFVTCLKCGRVFYTSEILKNGNGKDRYINNEKKGTYQPPSLTQEEIELIEKNDQILREYHSLKSEKEIKKAVKKKYKVLLWIGIIGIFFYYLGIILLIYRNHRIKKDVAAELEKQEQIKNEYNLLQLAIKKNNGK